MCERSINAKLHAEPLVCWRVGRSQSATILPEVPGAQRKGTTDVEKGLSLFRNDFEFTQEKQFVFSVQVAISMTNMLK